MAEADKGKNIFQAAINAVTNQDDKAAIEAASQHAQELEQQLAQMNQKLSDSESKVAELTASLSKLQAEHDVTCSDLITAKNTVTVTQQRLAATNAELEKYVSADQARQIAAAAEAAAKAQILTEHTLKPDETLSHLSLKYYGSAYEPYWRVIYEANKALIGDNPARVRPGMVIKIPVLPPELAKK